MTMAEVLMYSAKSAAVLCMLYVPYTLLLHRDSFFRQNRLVLLGILLLSLVLPLCNVPWLSMDRQPVMHAAQVQMVEIGIPVQMVVPAEAEAAVERKASFPLFSLLTAIYMTGVCAVLLFRLWQMGCLHMALRRGCLWRQTEDGITVRCHAGRVAPYSWMRNIVISEQDYNESGREIVLHETGHIRNGHSWDILLLTLVQMLQWWNPLAYMLGVSLRDLHEYEADDYVLRRGVSARAYQILLIKKAVGYGSYTFANNFNHSLTKKRITMMRRSKSNPWMRSKALYVVPVAALALSAFATPEIVSPAEGVLSEPESKGMENYLTGQAGGEENQQLSGKKPQSASAQPQKSQSPQPLTDEQKAVHDWFGAQPELMIHLMKNTRYPKECQEQGFQGKVLVSIAVEKDGSVSVEKSEYKPASSKKDASVVVNTYKNADGTQKAKLSEEELKNLMIKEAERVLKLSPKLKPYKNGKGETVRATFKVPVMFRLN